MQADLALMPAKELSEHFLRESRLCLVSKQYCWEQHVWLSHEAEAAALQWERLVWDQEQRGALICSYF